MDIASEFKDYCNSKAKDVDFVESHLSTKLSDEPGELLNQLRDIEAWGAYMGIVESEAEAYLDRAKFVFLELPDITKVKTSKDREIALDAQIWPFRAYRDHVRVLNKAINSRIMTALGILRYMRAVPDGDPGMGNPRNIFKGK